MNLFTLKFIISSIMFSNRVYSSAFIPKLAFPINKPNSMLKKGLRHSFGSTYVKVVTDIDDTVKSSGGVKILGIPIGGIDTHYNRGDFYPGAFQFAFEIASKGNSVPSKVAVLTARAREFKFALALKPGDKLCSAYAATGLSNGVEGWGIGDVYYGSVAEWIFQDRKGERKFKNFEIMMQNDHLNGKTENYILVGDTGEKDEEAGEKIARKHPNRIKAVFLHKVSEEKDRSSLVIPKDRKINGVPFYYFRTYVGAAKKAFEAGILNRVSVDRIIKQARNDLTIKEIPSLEKSKLSTRWRELEEDIAMLEETRRVKSSMATEELFSMFDFMAKSRR